MEIITVRSIRNQRASPARIGHGGFLRPAISIVTHAVQCPVLYLVISVQSPLLLARLRPKTARGTSVRVVQKRINTDKFSQ